MYMQEMYQIGHTGTASGVLGAITPPPPCFSFLFFFWLVSSVMYGDDDNTPTPLC